MSLCASITPGQFDNSFGMEQNGTVRTDAHHISGQSALLSDGSFVTVGYLEANPDARLGSIKHSADGFFDADYGVVTLPVTLTRSVYAIAAQPDGKVVVLGAYREGSNPDKAYLARLSANGELDQTFAEGGLKFLEQKIANNSLNVFALTVQPDGKVLAAFTDGSSSTIIRLDKNGQPDNFGQDGMVLLPNTIIQSLALHQGGFLIGGHNRMEGIVLRYLDSGGRDPAFANNGAFKFKIKSGLACVFALATEVNGNITLAGAAWHLPSETNFIARLLQDGRFDGSFNQGTVLETGTGNGVYKALAIQADGKALALARDQYRGFLVNVVRHNPNGQWDSTFGEGGVALGYSDPQGRPQDSQVDKIKIQPDGKILVSGFYRAASYIGRLLG